MVNHCVLTYLPQCVTKGLIEVVLWKPAELPCSCVMADHNNGICNFNLPLSSEYSKKMCDDKESIQSDPMAHPETSVAQLVKPWPADQAVPSLIAIF